MVHYCGVVNKGNPTVDNIIEQYQQDDVDFHQMVADMAGITRTEAKTVNLGIMYGMGQGKLASTLDITVEDAKKLLLDVLNICDKDNIPYMGWQYKENIFWPKEKPSWTSAAAILAADTILDFSNASDLFKRDQSNLY